MDISGVVVRTHPERATAVKSRLCSLPGVEVHAVSKEGRMVVTIENPAVSMIDTINSLNDIEGVLSTSLIYHHADELELEP
jgi:nitrate reductase NapD